MSHLTIYGIPNCGTCKKALTWLTEHQIPYHFINLKDHPPDAQTIASWVNTLGSKPLRNTSGQSYRALGNDRQTWTEEQWIAAFAQDAMLLKRPIVLKNDQAIGVGFRDKGWQLGLTSADL
ncbi:MAG: arsenate reductase family protein [Prochlorotrichaceae cyanobacterium]|jgi:arsenate reductase